jgi:transcriptional regulator with XRE-family HTH domain
MKYYRNDAFLKAVGRRIREIRGSKGITQDSLAFNMGDKFNSQLSLMEKGKTNFAISLLILLAQHLEVPLRDLLPESYLEFIS